MPREDLDQQFLTAVELDDARDERNARHPFAHPETGEVLATKDQFQNALTEIELRMSPMWIVRRKIREAFADRFEPTLPKAIFRTEKQEKVARCPRCGSRLQA